jgi:hypothetical protein
MGDFVLPSISLIDLLEKRALLPAASSVSSAEDDRFADEASPASSTASPHASQPSLPPSLPPYAHGFAKPHMPKPAQDNNVMASRHAGPAPRPSAAQKRTRAPVLPPVLTPHEVMAQAFGCWQPPVIFNGSRDQYDWPPCPTDAEILPALMDYKKTIKYKRNVEHIEQAYEIFQQTMVEAVTSAQGRNCLEAWGVKSTAVGADVSAGAAMIQVFETGERMARSYLSGVCIDDILPRRKAMIMLHLMSRAFEDMTSRLQPNSRRSKVNKALFTDKNKDLYYVKVYGPHVFWRLALAYLTKTKMHTEVSADDQAASADMMVRAQEQARAVHRILQQQGPLAIALIDNEYLPHQIDVPFGFKPAEKDPDKKSLQRKLWLRRSSFIKALYVGKPGLVFKILKAVKEDDDAAIKEVLNVYLKDLEGHEVFNVDTVHQMLEKAFEIFQGNYCDDDVPAEKGGMKYLSRQIKNKNWDDLMACCTQPN